MNVYMCVGRYFYYCSKSRYLPNPLIFFQYMLSLVTSHRETERCVGLCNFNFSGNCRSVFWFYIMITLNIFNFNFKFPSFSCIWKQNANDNTKKVTFFLQFLI